MDARTRYLCTTATAVLMLSALQARAQDAGGASDATQSEQTAVDAGEIVVTAQRRSELARDVPISITAIGADQLASAGITETSDLGKLSPGIKMDRVGNFTLPAIRGITTTITGPGADANVAIYLDGIYQPSTTSNTFDLPDVERVEVLKGPQGTLFGRNATGGAIQVFTRDPSYHPEGSLNLSYGNFNDFTASGFVSVPIVQDRAAVSLTGLYRSSDSYYENARSSGPGLDGAEVSLVRGKLLLDPTGDIRIVLTGRYSERTESAAIYGNPLNGNTVGRLLDPTAVVPIQPLDVALNDESAPQRVETFDASLKIEVDLGGGTLSSLSGYVDSKVTNVLDADYSYAPNGLGINYHVTTHDEYFTQEVNYASALSGPLNFTLGAFYTNGEGSWDPLSVQTPAYSVTIYGTQKIESVAGFGEVYFDLTDRVSVIGGLRYSWEHRSLESGQLFGLAAPKPALTPRGEQSWDSFTPRFSIRYAVAPRSNIYFTYSKGFKSGVYNTTAQTADLANPEHVSAYELGFKGRLTDAVSLDAAAFYYDYTDLQANVFTNVGGVPLAFLRNAGKARIFGLEADATVRFSDMFDVRAAGSWLDSKYLEFSSASVNRPCTAYPVGGAKCDTTGSTPLLIGNASVPFDASGLQMIRAPKFSATFTANGHFDVAGGQLDLSSTVYYSTRVFYTFDHRVSQSPYATLDMRAQWSPHDSGLTLAVFGKNLTDKTTIGGTFITEVADGVSWTPPRTYGVSIGYRF